MRRKLCDRKNNCRSKDAGKGVGCGNLDCPGNDARCWKDDRNTMAYKTKQREYILAFLQNSGGSHITVAELVRHLQDNATPVGTATVYRTLEQLVEEGIVRKYVLDGKSSACYQFLSGEPHACQEHFHLKCTDCGRLFHVSCDYLSQLGEHLLEHHGFVIDHTKTVLYGLCADCAKKNEQARLTALP